ncbi:MAG: TatD family hydrolase [Armatimonadota bacterium]|nr:TatD family hydrolase [Armatimonadota bacterium]
MSIWTDTHCHLNHPHFAQDAAQVWRRARDAGVCCAIIVGYDLPSSQSATQVAAQMEGCFASVGIHPHDATQCDDNALLRLEQLTTHPRVVALGEIGLDYYRNLSPKEVQQQAFVQQLQLALQQRLPVIIHCRDAYDDLLNILAQYPLRGVLHCFSGDLHHAHRAVEMGWYLGIGGVVTFQNAHTLREVVRQVPVERLLLETDAPYLAPMPHRGKRNEPAYIPLIAQAVAALKGLSPESLAQVTTQNARLLFSLDW